jgi:hypothetical protein
VCGPDGRYSGEILNINRLITNISKNHTEEQDLRLTQIGQAPYADYVGCVMYAGYEDFPRPDRIW